MNDFTEKIYETVRKIPEGKVSTYGQIAFLTGHPRAGRIVGGALERCPGLDIAPCHRVVYKDGSLCRKDALGFSAVQREMLNCEGVSFLPDGRVDLQKCLWDGETDV